MPRRLFVGLIAWVMWSSLMLWLIPLGNPIYEHRWLFLLYTFLVVMSSHTGLALYEAAHRRTKEVSDEMPETNELLYAISTREDGGIRLTVFDQGESASVELSGAMVEQLIKQLRNRGRRSPDQFARPDTA